MNTYPRKETALMDWALSVALYIRRTYASIDDRPIL
jgi:hypothetical protein